MERAENKLCDTSSIGDMDIVKGSTVEGSTGGSSFVEASTGKASTDRGSTGGGSTVPGIGMADKANN